MSTSSQIGLPIDIRPAFLRSGWRSQALVDPVNDDFYRETLSNCDLLLTDEGPQVIDGVRFPVFVLKDREGQFRYQIGARDILESMAYTIERSIFDNIDDAPMLPYRTAEILLTSLCPELGSDLTMTAALCELSLSGSNPVKMFIGFAQRLRQTSFRPTSVNDLTDFLLQDLSFHGLFADRRGHTFEQTVVRSFKIARRQIHEFLKSPDLQKVWQWTQGALSAAYSKRIDNRTFITSLLSKPTGKDNLDSLITKQLGVPAILTFTGEAFTLDQTNYSDRLLVFPAMGQVVRQILQKAPDGCRLQGVCNRAADDRLTRYRTSAACGTAPWARASDRPLCPFAAV